MFFNTQKKPQKLDCAYMHEFQG